MLGSPLGAVVAATDPAATTAFLEDLGVRLGRNPGSVEVVQADGSWHRDALDGGLAALDFYVRSVSDRPHVTVELGPLVMHQARILGPDGLPVVLIDANHRRPSILDTTDASVSEAHSMVWVVPSADETLAFFRAAGLTVVFDAPIASPAVCELVGLPEGTPVRMAMVADEALTPMRFEVLEAPGIRPWEGPVTAGLAWPVFADDGQDLPWVSAERVAPGIRRCVAPGGVLVELRA